MIAGFLFYLAIFRDIQRLDSTCEYYLLRIGFILFYFISFLVFISLAILWIACIYSDWVFIIFILGVKLYLQHSEFMGYHEEMGLTIKIIFHFPHRVSSRCFGGFLSARK